MNTYYRTVKAISQIATLNDVIEYNPETGVATNINTNKDMSFVNLNNLAFFSPINEFTLDQPIFKLGDLVSYKYGATPKSIYEIIKIDRTVKCLNRGIKVTYRYTIKDVNTGKEYRDTSDCYMSPLRYYYFINSNCQVHRATVTNSEADIYRKLTKNWYNTKEEADAVLDALFMKNFNCNRNDFHYNFGNMNGAEILNKIQW